MEVYTMALDNQMNGISHTSDFASVGGKKRKSKATKKTNKRKTAKKGAKKTKKSSKKGAKRKTTKNCLLCKKKKCKGLFCFL